MSSFNLWLPESINSGEIFPVGMRMSCSDKMTTERAKISPKGPGYMLEIYSSNNKSYQLLLNKNMEIKDGEYIVIDCLGCEKHVNVSIKHTASGPMISIHDDKEEKKLDKVKVVSEPTPKTKNKMKKLRYSRFDTIVYYDEFTEKILNFMEKNNISRRDLADILEVHESTVHRMLNSKTKKKKINRQIYEELNQLMDDDSNTHTVTQERILEDIDKFDVEEKDEMTLDDSQNKNVRYFNFVNS